MYWPVGWLGNGTKMGRNFSVAGSNAVGRDLVAREHLPGQGISRFLHRLGEVPRSLGCRRDDHIGSGRTRFLAQTFVGGEEKHAVARHGPAHRAAKMIALQFAFFHGKEILGVERIVTQELIQTALERVRAGLGHGVDHRAHVPPELGAEVAGLNAEFLERVGIRNDRRHAHELIVVVPTIQHVVVGGAAKSVHGDGRLLTGAVAAVADHDARQQELQLTAHPCRSTVIR